jgi:predicted transcriptional regulator
VNGPGHFEQKTLFVASGSKAWGTFALVLPFVILSPMTKLLSAVMRKITELPEQRQDDAARVLLMMLEQDPEQYRLTDAQLREVDAAIADTDAGNFAPEKEIDAILNRSWA